MIVWGGSDDHNYGVQSGGRFDFDTYTWEPVTTVGAPFARSGHVAVWTGEYMLVFGGGSYNENTVYRYTPPQPTFLYRRP